MTTIAYKDGVLAADTLAMYGATKEAGHVRKIWRARDGRLVAICGTASITSPYAAALIKHSKTLPTIPKDEGRVIEIMPSGEVFSHECGGSFSLGKLKYGAWGSGSDVARGAMLMGASAVRAVKIAMLIDCNTGGRIESVKL